MKSLHVAVALCSLLLLVGLDLAELKAITLSKKTPNHTTPVSRPLSKSPAQGGPNGTAFDDLVDYDFNGVATIIGVRSINISFGDQVDSIQVTYILSNGSLFETPRRGKLSDQPLVNITLTPEESITKIEGKTNGALVDQLTITTVGPDYERKVYGPFGKTGLLSFSFEGHVIGFHGGYGDLLDKIGVYSVELLKKSDEYGGEGGSRFDDKADIKTPPIVRISQINIWNGELIDAFQVEYLLLGGSFTLGPKHGQGNSGILTTITFAEGEKISAMEGQIGDNYLSQLTFITEKEDGSEGKYGPFGTIGKHSFYINGNILGFYGFAGHLIDKIGVYYI